MGKPEKPGWYWFLPDENCPTPTGLLRIDRPVVVLVGQESYDRAGPPKKLVVRFSWDNMLFVDEMSGDWEQCREPNRMRQKAMKRINAKHGH